MKVDFSALLDRLKGEPLDVIALGAAAEERRGRLSQFPTLVAVSSDGGGECLAIQCFGRAFLTTRYRREIGTVYELGGIGEYEFGGVVLESSIIYRVLREAAIGEFLTAASDVPLFERFYEVHLD